MRKKVEATCSNCQKLFLKDESEVKRNLRKGRKNFCSRHCCGKGNEERIKKYSGVNSTSNISKFAQNRHDEYTGLRDFIRRANNRDQEVSITKEDLLEVWNRQKGICPYTGISLLKPTYRHKNCPINTASLDRIDSSKGYIKENIQFVSTVINFMKTSMSHDKTIEVCKIITNYWNMKNLESG